MSKHIDRRSYVPWVRWCCEHRMAWLVRAVVVMAFPFYLAAYLGEAVDDCKRDLRSVK
jgi:hypothetical protein